MMKRREEEEKFLDVNAAMQGSLAFSDPVNLRINGKFEGTLTTKGNLIIGESARVSADIVGESITVSGIVNGKIKATQALTLTASAAVYGDVETPKISIEEGAAFNGKCRMSGVKLSLPELSEYLSIDPAKIRDWVDKGKIPVEREGNDLWFDRNQVDVWIGNNV